MRPGVEHFVQCAFSCPKVLQIVHLTLAYPAPVPSRRLDGDQFTKAVGDRVRVLRQARRLSRQQLADMVGLSKSAIGMIERGQRLNWRRLADIAQALECTPRDLLDFKDASHASSELAEIVALVQDASKRDPSFPATLLRVARSLLNK